MKRPKPGAAWISASRPAPTGAGWGSRLKVAGSEPEVAGAGVMPSGYRDTRTSKYRVFGKRRTVVRRHRRLLPAPLPDVRRHERRLDHAHPHPASAHVHRDLVVLAHPGRGVDQREPDPLAQGR